MNIQSSFDYKLKILVIGDSGVGKTNFLFRFVENKFNQIYSSTIGINKSNGLELVENDHKLNINNSSNITNITNIINNKTGENISNYNNNNKKSSYDKEINISSKNSSDKYDKIIFWQYIILAIFSFIFFIIIIFILYFKYFKKNDMKKMNIANENNINNNIIIKDNKKKDSSYEKIATEVDTKEIKDNKDNQSVIVIES